MRGQYSAQAGEDSQSIGESSLLLSVGLMREMYTEILTVDGNLFGTNTKVNFPASEARRELTN